MLSDAISWVLIIFKKKFSIKILYRVHKVIALIDFEPVEIWNEFIFYIFYVFYVSVININKIAFISLILNFVSFEKMILNCFKCSGLLISCFFMFATKFTVQSGLVSETTVKGCNKKKKKIIFKNTE